MWETDRHRWTHWKRAEAETGAMLLFVATVNTSPSTMVTDIHPRVTAQSSRSLQGSQWTKPHYRPGELVSTTISTLPTECSR